MSGRLRIIAICGARRSGKDTAADYIVSNILGGPRANVRKVHFAAPIKRMACEAFGFSVDQVEGSGKDEVDERYGVTPRRVLQFLGTEVMQYKIRDIIPTAGRTFWARRLIQTELEASRSFERSVAVVADMRFPHEAEALVSELGAENVFIVRLRRHSTDRKTKDEDAHSSETEYLAIRSVDAEIENSGSVDDLYAKLDRLGIAF